MSLPQVWKIRRELWRVWLKTKLLLIRVLRLRTSMTYVGLQIPLNRKGMSGEVVMGIASGLYEKPEINGLSRVLRPGDRILELGAGLGVVTALSSKAAGPEGRILAYEADPKLMNDTQEFLNRHGASNVELRNAVLVPTAAPGDSRTFHVSRIFALSSLVPHGGSKRYKTISVPAEAVNDVVEEFRPHVLICDIEGGEAELIPAMDVSGLRAVVIEMHPKRIAAGKIAAVRDALERQGLAQDPEPLGGTVELFTRASVG